MVCEMLAADRDDMVVKALSWALRALSAHDQRGVRAFLGEHDATPAARIKREVGSKLRTGRKSG
jgi:3-methyladenine DNA glycosylase AlkD